MAGHRCPIRYRFSHKARVDVNNGRLKAIKATLDLSRRPIHVLLFEVGIYFGSLANNHKINRQGGSDLFGTPVSRHKI